MASLHLPFEWNAGEHLAIVGSTGTGKSTLAAALLERWSYLIAIRTKPDKVRYNAKTIKTAVKLDDPRIERAVLEPAYEDQHTEITDVLERVWQQGGWTCYVDESFYLQHIGVVKPVERLMTQGRSKGITMVVGMQRPARISRFLLSEVTHLVSFSQEGRDAKIIGEAANKALEQQVQTLERYQFAWFYRPSREIFVGKLQDLQEAH